MQLRRNGTGPNFQNGDLEGDEENLTAFQNGGVISTNKVALSPSTMYGGMRLCAVYSKSPSPIIYCSNSFSITTPAATAPVTLSIISPSSTPTSVSFSWTTPSQFQSYHVRLNDGDEQTVEGSTFTYGYPPLNPATQYQVSVEGCSYVGISGSSCTNKWVTAMITTQVAPPVVVNPPVKVTSKQYSMKPFGAGDCTLQNGNLVFRSDGTFSFSAQVRTAHTTTSDYWHIELDLLDGSGKVIDNVPEFTGPAMKDAHPGYYNWSHNGSFGASVYPALSSVRMPGRC